MIVTMIHVDMPLTDDELAVVDTARRRMDGEEPMTSGPWSREAILQSWLQDRLNQEPERTST